MSLQIKSTSRRRVQFKLTLTATFRANSFHSDVMFRWIAKGSTGKKNEKEQFILELGKEKDKYIKKRNIIQTYSLLYFLTDWEKDSSSHREINELICS